MLNVCLSILHAPCIAIYASKRILCCSMASGLIFSSGIMASLSSCSSNLFRSTLTSTGSVESTFALYSEIHSLCLLMSVLLSPLSGNPSSYPPMHLTSCKPITQVNLFHRQLTFSTFRKPTGVSRLYTIFCGFFPRSTAFFIRVLWETTLVYELNFITK